MRQILTSALSLQQKMKDYCHHRKRNIFKKQKVRHIKNNSHGCMYISQYLYLNALQQHANFKNYYIQIKSQGHDI